MVIAIIAILAALLMPALGRAQAKAYQSACASNLRQMGLAWSMYLGEHADRFPDRRDLKLSLPGGYMPWNNWPKSDPRSGWAALVLTSSLPELRVWTCPGLARSSIKSHPACSQLLSENLPERRSNYWLWRFDRTDEPVALDNFWGKTIERLMVDLVEAKNPIVGEPSSPSQVELTVDSYFPATAPDVDPAVAGGSSHPLRFNRLHLDGHVTTIKDRRLRR